MGKEDRAKEVVDYIKGIQKRFTGQDKGYTRG